MSACYVFVTAGRRPGQDADILHLPAPHNVWYEEVVRDCDSPVISGNFNLGSIEELAIRKCVSISPSSGGETQNVLRKAIALLSALLLIMQLKSYSRLITII